MAATPEARAPRPRRRCRASPGTRRRCAAAMRRWQRDFTPITDCGRAPPTARSVARNLLLRLLHRDQPTSERRDAPRRRPEARPCLTRSSPSGSRAACSSRVATTARRQHVSGEAAYIDDLPEPAGLLHVYLGISAQRARADRAHRSRRRCAQAPGVVAGADRGRRSGRERRQPDPSPRRARCSRPAWSSTPASRCSRSPPSRDAGAARGAGSAEVDVRGAAAGARRRGGAAASSSRDRAADARARRRRGAPRRGPAPAAGPDRASAGRTISTSRARSRMAIPGEDDEVTVHSSTQHPSEVQHMVAHVLGRAATTRSRSSAGAWAAASAARRRKATCSPASPRSSPSRPAAPAKIRPDRDDDMMITGKRHDFVVDYDVGFDDDGRIHGVDMTFAARCGFSADLSGPVTDRALFHADNATSIENVAADLAAAQDQHRLQHGVPRLRRPAGHGGGRAGDRGDRLRARQGPARDPQAQLLRRRRAQRHALPSDGRGQRRPRDRRRARGERRLSAAARGDPRIQCQRAG